MTTAEKPDRQVRAEVNRARQTAGAVPNPAPLRWATGVFLAFVGARGLVVPQVSNQGAIDGLALLAPTLESFLIVQALLRVAILLAGVALILLAVRPQSGTFATVAQTAAFIVLAWWAAVLMSSGSAAAACLFGALALGIALTAALERDRGRIWARNRHPFNLVMIVAALAIGVLMLVPFGPYQAPVYEPVASQLPWIGATFVIGGTSLLVAELQRQALNVWSVIGRIVIAAAWFAWVLLFLAPFGLFNLVPFYVGFSLVLLLEPVVGPRLPRFDATTLRARTSLAMAAAIAVPMLLGMGVVSNFEEYVDRRTELDREQSQASAVAATLGMRLADMAGLASLTADQAGAPAGSLPSAVYTSQDFLGAAVLDPGGNPLWVVGFPSSFVWPAELHWAQGPRGSQMTVVDVDGQALVLVAQQGASSGNLGVVAASVDQLHAWIAPVMAIEDAHLLVVERTGGYRYCSKLAPVHACWS